MTVTHNISPQR